VSLRERGDRTFRGRSSRVPDPGADADHLLERARRRSESRRAAAAELVAAGDLRRSRLSRAARELLMEKLSGLVAAVSLAGSAAEDRDHDLDLLLRAAPTSGDATIITGDDGTVTIHGVALAALPLNAAGGTFEERISA
jgi:hypothetical protein